MVYRGINPKKSQGKISKSSTVTVGSVPGRVTLLPNSIVVRRDLCRKSTEIFFMNFQENTGALPFPEKFAKRAPDVLRYF
jgi:hypothetical protein